jgi:tetratricopeptide (TPR) repeat protein
LLLGLIEAVLRFAGFGHPTSFFVRKELGGKAVLVENGAFGLSFFPPALARSPSPVIMDAVKPPGVFRIFLFGESAAMGDPRPAFGMGRYLEALLRERFPGLKFEVVSTAVTAINSHAILPIARECAGYQGDLWIVYMGNNEFLGPFGGSTVFGARAPRNAWVRCYLGLQRTRLGQWLAAMTRGLGGSQTTPANWGGMRMFMDHQLLPHDPCKERLYANFSDNIEDIIQAGRRAGVPLILSSVACNLKDCAPFGSLHAPTLERSRLAEWEGLYRAGITNAARADLAGAIRSFEEAVKLSPDFAETHFRLGQCYLAVTNLEAARRSLGLARDLDSLPFRADSRINSIIADTARRFSGKGVRYLDAEGVLALSRSDPIPGWESFYEHVHLNFDGNYRLARALAEQVSTCLPASVLSHQQDGWVGAEVCARDLGLTDWNRCTVLEEIIRRLADPPFTQQLNHDLQVEKYSSELAECRHRLQPLAAEEARRVYAEALQNAPRDHWIHHNYAEFLSGVGDLPAATEEMRLVRDLTPQHYAAYFQLGRLLARQERFSEAAVEFEQVVRLLPDYAEAHLNLGIALGRQGLFDRALEQFQTVLRLEPKNAKARELITVAEKQKTRAHAP